MTTTRIAELSQRIATNTTKINAFFVANNIPEPSFSLDASPHLAIPQTETEILSARREVINDTQELRELMLGPREHLSSYDVRLPFTGFDIHDFQWEFYTQMLTEDWTQENSLVSLHAVTRFRLAHAFAIGSETTFADLAEKVGLGETHIRKIVRYAITQKIFCEPRPGVIVHSACSRLIAENETVYSYLRFKTDNFWHAAFHLGDAIAKWPGSEEPNQTGFSVAHQTDKSTFEYLSDHPETAKFFYNAMRAFAERPGLEPKYIIENYPWSSLSIGATVVDVGGSHGIVAIELSRAFPNLKLVVQDLDEPIIADADAQKPDDVADRVRFMVHDFLTPQPVSADVYYFRHIFHNWPDKYCVKILRGLVPVLRPGARIVVNDQVMPEPCTLPWEQEARLRSNDLNMLELQNAGDREMGEWENIFRKADERFVFKGGFKPEGSSLWILEAEWMG